MHWKSLLSASHVKGSRKAAGQHKLSPSGTGEAEKAHCPLIAEIVNNGDSYSALRKVLDSFQKRLYRSLVVVLGYSSFRSLPAVNTGLFRPLQNIIMTHCHDNTSSMCIIHLHHMPALCCEYRLTCRK